MRERYELRDNRFSCSPSQEGLHEFDHPGVTSDQPGMEKLAVRSKNVVRQGRFAARIAARSVGLLLLAVAMLAAPAASPAQVFVGVSVTYGPPALPIYAQPLCPGPNYIWTPGFWAWDPVYGYFWVPGTWVMAPFPGALWTPGYWGWNDGAYLWYDGYWGPVVGYYGGVVYGFGYTGYGYQGGYWSGQTFYYNRSVNYISTTNITNVYNKTVVNETNVSRVSYNGGTGGTTARPTSAQLAAAKQRRSGPVAEQTQQMQTAQREPKQRASINEGRPNVAATPRPGAFSGRDIVRASRAGAPYKPAPAATPRGRVTSQPNAAETSNPAGAEKSRRDTAPRGRVTSQPNSAETSNPAGAEKSPRVTAPRGRVTSQPNSAETSNPAGAGRSPRVTAPKRTIPPARTQRAAPEQGEPAQPKYDRSSPPQAQPNADRPRMEQRQAAPRATPRGSGKANQPEKRGGAKEQKPDKPHQ